MPSSADAGLGRPIRPAIFDGANLDRADISGMQAPSASMMRVSAVGVVWNEQTNLTDARVRESPSFPTDIVGLDRGAQEVLPPQRKANFRSQGAGALVRQRSREGMEEGREL